MVRLRTVIVSIVVILGLGGSAAAGPVEVFATWARGDMGTAHNSGGSIGCWVSTGPVGPPLLYCEANNGAGGVNFCSTTNLSMTTLAYSMTTVAEIQFGWDVSHGCTWLTIMNFSQPGGRNHP